jgi:hypothetical protein
MSDPERIGATATALLNGDILVAGGYPGMFISPCGNQNMTLPFNAEIYSLETGRWRVAAPMGTGRMYHTATRLLDGRVLVAGSTGAMGCLYQLPALNTAEIYDPTSDRWATVAPMNHARWLAAATLMSDGRVLVIGSPYDSSMEIYDPESDTWTLQRTNTYFAVPLLLRDGRILAAGLFQNTLTGPYEMDVAVYSGTSGLWQKLTTLPHQPSTIAMLPLPSGRVMVSISLGSLGSIADIFDPETSTWQSAPALTRPRDATTPILLTDGRILIVGWRRTLST